MSEPRTWVVYRSALIDNIWATTPHVFGPSVDPPSEAVVFLRRSYDNPAAWLPDNADEWDVTADVEIRRMANIDGPPAPVTADARAAIAQFKNKFGKGAA